MLLVGSNDISTCERGFSTQKCIKSKFRTRLNNKSLNDLMRISEDGPHIKEFDFQEALKNGKLRSFEGCIRSNE